MAPDGPTALMLSCQSGHDLCSRALLVKGASLEAVSKDNFTMLMAASYGGLLSVVTQVLPLSDIDAAVVSTHASQAGYTALMYASSNGHELCARALLEAGSDRNIVSSAGSSALKLAESAGHTAICDLLICDLLEA